MGWASGGEIFNPVARKMQELGLGDEARTELLTVLIEALQQGDWDTEEESLEEFYGDPAIVEAFRRQEITLACSEHEDEGAAIRWCERERGPLGHADGLHEDGDGVTWPVGA